MNRVEFKCPLCDGEGGWGNNWDEPYKACSVCDGEGVLSPWRRLRYWWLAEVWFGWLYDKLTYRWYERDWWRRSS